MNESDNERPETLKVLTFNESNEMENDPEKCDVTPLHVKPSIPVDSFPGQSADYSSHTAPIARSPFESIEELKEKTEGAHGKTYPETEMTIISNKEKKEIAARPERETEHKTRKMDEGGRKPRGGRKPSKLRVKESRQPKLSKEEEGNPNEVMEEEEKHRPDSESEYEWDAETEINEKLTITDYGCDFCTRLGIVCTTVRICTDCIRTKLSGGNS